MNVVQNVDGEIHRLVREPGVLPVVTISDERRAGPLANALKAGGLAVAEVTFRTRAATEALSQMTARAELVAGAGTVITPGQVDLALKAGARFVVSPGVSERVIYRCRELGLLPIPGVCTATDVIAALDLDCELLKFFPADVSGGPKTLQALHGAFPAVRFIATGGIRPANLADYLALPFVAAVGGSWIAPDALVDKGAFSVVSQLESEAAALAREARV